MRAGLPPSALRPRDTRLLPRDGRQPRARQPSRRSARTRSKAATCGWCGPAATIGSGTASRSDSLGSFDLLKTISSHRQLGYGRHNRWEYLGLVNEPCFTEATGPDPNRFGLWLDVRDPACPPDPFAEREEYPGVAIGARGKTVAVGSYYGEPTGDRRPAALHQPRLRREGAAPLELRAVLQRSGVLLRSRPRPAVSRRHVVRASATSGPNPIRPPADAEARAGRTSARIVGAQYFWWDRVFNWHGDEERRQRVLSGAARLAARHARHLARLDRQHQQPADDERGVLAAAAHGPGEGSGARRRWPAAGCDNKQFNDFVPPDDPLAQFFFASPSTTWTPRVLKDGSDSVGALGALNRVYLNIGLFSEEWLLHFRPLLGGKPISPIPIATAQRNSAYWRATEMQTPEHGALLARQHRSALPEGRARVGAQYLDRRRGDGRARQGGVRRALRAVPFEQAAAAAAGLDLENANGPELPRSVEHVLGVDEDRRVQGADARRWCSSRRLPRRATTCRPSCACRSRCSASTPAVRSRPTRSATTSGTTSRPSRTRRCPRSARMTIRHPVTGAEMRLSAAGGRARLHPAGLARQPLVDRAVPSEQHRRAVRVRIRRSTARMRSFDDVDRADAAGPSARDAIRSSPARSRRRSGGRRHRPHHRGQLPRGAGEPTSPDAAPAAGRSWRGGPVPVRRRRRARPSADRAVPEGHADRAHHQHRHHRRGALHGGAEGAQGAAVRAVDTRQARAR